MAWKQDAIQPGTGFTTKPGVAATRRTPGCEELRSKPQRGFTRSAANASGDCGTPFGVQTPDVDRNPGCAAPRRPWALLCNPAGVFKTLFCRPHRPRSPETLRKILHGFADQHYELSHEKRSEPSQVELERFGICAVSINLRQRGCSRV